MADERVPPQSDPANDPPLDATSRMPPVGGDAPTAGIPGAAGEGTRPLPRAGAPGPDATQAMPAVDSPVDPWQNDATQAMGGPGVGGPHPDATQVGGPPATARWAGRAGVPVAGAPGVRQSAPGALEEEPLADPYGGRSWFTPVLLGILALVLLTALGVGIWLITRATGDDLLPAEQPSVPAVTATPPPVSTAPPSTAPPSETPSAPETTARPATVVVPTVRGMTRAAATAALQSAGLVVAVVQQTDPNAPAGTAIGTDPAAGSDVDQGSRVTLFVAAAPPRTPAAPTSAAVSPSRSSD